MFINKKQCTTGCSALDPFHQPLVSYRHARQKSRMLAPANISDDPSRVSGNLRSPMVGSFELGWLSRALHKGFHQDLAVGQNQWYVHHPF